MEREAPPHRHGEGLAKYLVAVRYGLMMSMENFQADVDGLGPGDAVIIRTNRGIDWGEVCNPVQRIDREIKGLGTIMRGASETDLGIIHHIREVKEPEEIRYCRDRIGERRLPMKLVGVEHLFGGDKIVFYFLADGRVDFRELVKDLARKYRTRIEMRQIGVRDEAKLLADFEHCGRELCCRTFLRNLEPVTMRMAKTQKTTLDPSKISGHCGRLMCCLRFEDAVYSELRKELPKRGKTAVTPQVQGTVIGQNILKQTVLLQLKDGTRETVHVSEIVEIRGREGGGRSAGRRRPDSRNRDNKAPARKDTPSTGSKENKEPDAPQQNTAEASSSPSDSPPAPTDTERSGAGDAERTESGDAPGGEGSH